MQQAQAPGRSVHITYDLDDHEQRSTLREGILRLVRHAARESGTPPANFRILDAGCGMGLMMRDLSEAGFTQVVGVDFDPTCVESAGRFGTSVRGDVQEIARSFDPDSFDLVIISHVLEHLRDPSGLLEQARQVSTRWVVAAVPNPIRPHIVLKYAVRGKDYSNRGHVYSWDRSHFTNFLELQNDIKVIRWSSDGVKLVPGRILRRPLRKLGLLERIEMGLLPRVMPYFSTSLIALGEFGASNPGPQPSR